MAGNGPAFAATMTRRREREAVWNLWQVSRTTRAASPLTRFTSSSGYVRYPAVSPRGDRVVFERSMLAASLWTVKLP